MLLQQAHATASHPPQPGVQKYRTLVVFSAGQTSGTHLAQEYSLSLYRPGGNGVGPALLDVPTNGIENPLKY